MGAAPDRSRGDRRSGGTRQAVANWVLLDGDRPAVAAIVVVAVILVFGALVGNGVVYVGPGGSVGTLFASGVIAGLVTLLTLALSINQLVISRVFGSPNELADRLEGTRTVRHTVESLAGAPASPTDPSDFLSLLAATLRDRATALESTLVAADREPPSDVIAVTRDLAAYGDEIEGRLADRSSIMDALGVIIGSEYSEHLVAVHRLRNTHTDSLTEPATTEVRALDELLEALAISRQFFKTMALQQDFAELGRHLIYNGLIALVVAITLALVYRSDSTTVSPGHLKVVVSIGLGVALAPLASFVSSLSRAATIAYKTVSVGPFIPPSEQR